jgi:SAM-dependent methyltransferase
VSHALAVVVFERASILADDAAFDERLPLALQIHASTFFTPINVAAYAAHLLAPSPGMTVLDVGAGAGKFCIAAGLAVPTCEFVGVEWRPHLVDLANALARELRVPNVRFIQGDALELDWSMFDSFYLFNPFAELNDEDVSLDRTIEVDPDSFIRCVCGVRQKLASARIGTRVVTYHGFGAPPPVGYKTSLADPVLWRRLEMWIKTHDVMGGEVEPEPK